MDLRKLGASDIEIAPVGIGCWAIGGWMWGGTDEQQSLEAVQRGVDEGLNLIDTAPIYGFGRSEELVGRAIKSLPRESYVLATKCGLNWWADEGEFFMESEGRTVFRNLRPASIRKEVEDSLRRLDLDCIDLLQPHWPDPTTPIDETMEAMVKLKDEGKIRAIGACNLSGEQMRRYLAAGPFVSNQVRYSMLDREIEDDQLPLAREKDVAILAYSPLALGLLTGKISPSREFPEGDLRRNNPRFTPENRRHTMDTLATLEPLREKYGLTQTQLTIAWTVNQPGVTCALVGMRRGSQAAEGAGGAFVELDPEDIKAIDDVVHALR